MRVVQLQAENFKRLKAIDITPGEGMVVLTGRNAQGKSSVLDAIWAAVGGTKASPENPIRDGETAAEVTVDLGEISVTRRWKGGKSDLTVTAAGGAKVSSPQKVLDALVGSLSFDPLKFANASPREQREMLLAVVDLPINLGVVQTQRQEAYDARTEIGREVKRLQGALDSLPTVPGDTPNDEIDIVQLSVQLTHAQGGFDAMTNLFERKQRLDAELAQLMKDAGQVASVLPMPFGELQGWIETKRGELMGAEAKNAAVRARKAKIQGQSEVRTAQQRYDEKTAAIERLDTQKAHAISRATMPVEGLGFDDDGVTYQGVAFSQASGAERIKVSVGMAMALNPTLRVIHIADGSLLDNESMGELYRMGLEHDYQIWVERVDESGQIGIVIEDGEVLA